MSTMDRPMPDFADALERHLRLAAAEAAAHARAAPAAAPPRRSPFAPPGRARGPVALPRVGWRPLAAAGSLAVVALVLLAVLVLGGSGSSTAPALGRPLVLRAPLADLPAAALPGGSAAAILGPAGTAITRGHEIPTAAGPAYVYGNSAGACLTAPDPLTDRPEVERGVACAPQATFLRFGLALTLSGADRGTYYAALPPGVRAPTVRTADGRVRTLRPSSFGVVTVTGGPGTVITRYDRDGGRQEDLVVHPAPTGPAVAPQPATPVPPGPRTTPGP